MKVAVKGNEQIDTRAYTIQIYPNIIAVLYISCSILAVAVIYSHHKIKFNYTEDYFFLNLLGVF